jgi:hypothetical protein
MLSKTRDAAGVSLKGVLAALLAAFGLTACGSGGSTSTNATSTPPGTAPTTTTVSASATPVLVAYNATAVITWSSTDSTSCSSSPAGISGTAGTYTTPALTATTTYIITCTGPTGPASKGVTITVASSSIVGAAAACAAEPMRGTVYYYCDCGIGREDGCVAGDDDTGDGSVSNPFKTVGYSTFSWSKTYSIGDKVSTGGYDYVSLANSNTSHPPGSNLGTYWRYANSTHHSLTAASKSISLSGTNTLAFCKGGAFDTVDLTLGNAIGNNSCTAGTTCTDFREYSSPDYFSSAKPLFHTDGTAAILNVAGAKGGIRFMNLKLAGNSGAPNGGGFFLYNGAHDIKICNVDMDSLGLAIHSTQASDGTGKPTNITVTGNSITNVSVIGFLGGGNNLEISYNEWGRVGNNDSLNHTIYLGGMDNANVTLLGNYVHGQNAATCTGGPVIAHGSFDGLLVKDNLISIAASEATNGCWGLSFNNLSGTTHPVYYRNSVFSGNIIVNGGNKSMSISDCPGCIIENNIIIQNWKGGSVGISIADPARDAGRGDDVSNANVIRNNTIWFGPLASSAMYANYGIVTKNEGTGHIISNNTVSSEQTTGTLNCFQHDLPLGSYAFINNNHCHSAANYSWVTGRGNLTAWQTYAADYSFDTESATGDPKFTAPGTDFTPAVGSPLIGHGIAAHGSTSDITGKERPDPPAIGAYEP